MSVNDTVSQGLAGIGVDPHQTQFKATKFSNYLTASFQLRAASPGVAISLGILEGSHDEVLFGFLSPSGPSEWDGLPRLYAASEEFS
jgi:hypothetical protein